MLDSVLPIIIPGVVLHVLAQAYFIKHCWENEKLSQQSKFIYILAMIVCNLPAAALYLFNNRENTVEHTGDLKDINIDNNVMQGIFVLLIIAFEIFAIRVLNDNSNNPHYFLMCNLLIYCYAIMLIFNLLIRELPLLLYYLLPATQLLIAIPIQYLDSTYNAQYILVIITASIINKFPLSQAKIYSIAAFCAFLIGNTAKTFKYYNRLDFNDILSYLYVNSLVFLLIIAVFYTLKKQLLIKKRLDLLLVRVREQADQIERMGAIAERSRLTADIHDMVGHTLISAVISIEAAEKLLSTDINEAAIKMSLAKEQVKRGLEDIRTSVSTIRAINETFEFALNRMIDDIRQATGLTINSIMELESELLPVQKSILLLAVKECITNALKHGKCTVFDILVQEYNGEIQLSISDNGEGTDFVRPGSGLSIMRERLKSIGGELQIDSVKGEGFTVNISIPIGIKQGGDSV